MEYAQITENSFSKSMRHVTAFLVDVKQKPNQNKQAKLQDIWGQKWPKEKSGSISLVKLALVIQVHDKEHGLFVSGLNIYSHDELTPESWALWPCNKLRFVFLRKKIK